MEQKWEGKEHAIFPYKICRDTWGHFVPEPDLVTPRTREGGSGRMARIDGCHKRQSSEGKEGSIYDAAVDVSNLMHE